MCEENTQKANLDTNRKRIRKCFPFQFWRDLVEVYLFDPILDDGGLGDGDVLPGGGRVKVELPQDFLLDVLLRHLLEQGPVLCTPCASFQINFLVLNESVPICQMHFYIFLLLRLILSDRDNLSPGAVAA